jgi:hypothetical protein
MNRPVALLVVLVLGACGNGEPGPGAITTSTTSTSATTLAATPRPTSPPHATPQACGPVTGGGVTSVYLTDVRVGSRPGYDRVTFEFAVAPSAGDLPTPPPPGLLPKYQLKKVSSINLGESDELAQIAGRELYQIAFSGAAAHAGEDAHRTYNGPDELKPGFPVLTEAEFTYDFEGSVEWGFGIAEASCPKVTEFQNPLRVAVDFPH